jgi:hypothetical protein
MADPIGGTLVRPLTLHPLDSLPVHPRRPNAVPLALAAVTAAAAFLVGCGDSPRGTAAACPTASRPRISQPGAGGQQALLRPPAADHHDEYVFTDKGYYVYEAERHFALVRMVRVPGITQLRDAVADARRGVFYISYGANHIKKWSFRKGRQIWDKTYTPATDAGALSPDGGTLYMATGSSNPPDWLVIDTARGCVRRVIHASGSGSHNTDISLDGRYVYLGIHNSPHMGVYDTVTRRLRYVRGLVAGVRPIAVTGSGSYAFITQTGYFGFSVGDIRRGKDLFNVGIKGFPRTSPSYAKSGGDAPSHGISVSPDEKEVWVMDRPNGMVHVFDITGLPTVAPRQVANIAVGNMDSNEAECSKSCLREGWVQFSRDGKYVYVGDAGAVIDARTRRVIARLPALHNSRKQIEVDWKRGRPVWASPTRSQTGYVR